MKVQILAVALAGLLALSGCITGEEDIPDTDPAPVEEPQTGNVTVEELPGAIANAVATPVISFNNAGTYNFPLDPSPANITGFVLELTWDATVPTHEELDLWIRDAALGTVPPDDPADVLDNQPILKATGTSPLRLAVPSDALDRDTDYSMLVRAPTPVGVVVEQPFVLKVATFDGVEFDAEYVFA